MNADWVAFDLMMMMMMMMMMGLDPVYLDCDIPESL